jgi:hypothetical protein
VYTVEFEKDASVIISIDEADKFEDIQVTLQDDDTVYLIQYEEELDSNQVIYISYQQLLDVMAALQSPEGAFYAKFASQDQIRKGNY